MKAVYMNDAAGQRSGGGAAGIRLVLDRAAGLTTFQVLTCVPLDTPR